MENNEVVAVAFDKSTGRIMTCTICSKEDSQVYAKYYRSIGYKSKVMTHDELDAAYDKIIKEMERNERLAELSRQKRS